MKICDFEIIDFHTHPFLRENEYTCMYREAVTFSVEEFKKSFTEIGIDIICGSVITFDDIQAETVSWETLERLNRDALALRERYGSFYVPGFHVHPGYVRESCEEIALMASKGIRLIGELVPYLQGWSDYSCRELSEILDVAEQYHMVVSFHTMDHDQITKMVAGHPNITFVMAHPNEKEQYVKHIERMKRYDNCYLDLAGTGLFRYGMLKYGVEQVGAERFLFGTDFPITNHGMYVQAVLQEQITDNDRALIFAGNAKRILGL